MRKFGGSRNIFVLLTLLSAVWLSGAAWAEPAVVEVTSSLGEVDMDGDKIPVFEIRIFENEIQEALFTPEDLEKSKKNYLAKRQPAILDAAGMPAPLKYLGREIKQTATDNRLSRWIIFKYQQRSGPVWDWKQPVRVRFDGRDYELPPVVS
jgi:hypothetical protein